MHPVFRAFKRHYHKVSKVYSELVGTGSFSLEVKFDGNTLQTKSVIPDESLTIRFVTLMRRFLNTSDALYFGNIWSILKYEFANEFSEEHTEWVESGMENLNRGFMDIKINNRNLTAEEIYRILAEGVCFGNNEEIQKYLADLRETPITLPLLWNQFYIYTLAGFELASAIFQVVEEVQKSDRYKTLYPDLPVVSRCIYCLKTEGPFTSEEHIFPEALGNDELVLPKGYVCDTCNNQVLSSLDQFLVDFSPIAFLRVLFVPYTKAGKLPRAKFQNIHIERTRPNHVMIQAQDASGNPKDKKDLGDSWQSFNLSMRGSNFHPKMLGRALYKIALGMVAFDQGAEEACASKYDQVRSFIVDHEDFPNNLVMCMKAVPNPQVYVQYQNNLGGTLFVMSIFGIIFMLNLEGTPPLELNEQLKQLQFEMFPLRGNQQ